MSASLGRRAALEVVTRVRERDAYAHETLDSVLSARQLTGQDASTATRTAYGTIQSLGTLEEALARYVKRPTRLEPRVRDALLIAAWEILFSATPGPVAVNEGVELARSVRPAAAGLANAVLRRLAADSSSFPWTDDPLKALAARHAHPVWLAELLSREYGPKTAERIMEANNLPAPLYLAHNPFAAQLPDVVAELEECGVEPRTWVPDGCMRAESPAAAVRCAALSEGRVVACDAMAQLAASFAATPGGKVVEIGAGRGTKTLLIQAASARAGAPAAIFAIDSHEFKTRLLGQRMNALGVPGVTTCHLDATDIPSDISSLAFHDADLVFVDAPCSGLGTLRRHPDKRWRMRESEIELVSAVASALLRESSRLVRPGGFMLYSTCSLTRAENADVVEGFLASEAGSGFTVADLSARVPARYAGFIQAGGWIQSLPEPGGPDGHFIACLTREPLR